MSFKKEKKQESEEKQQQQHEPPFPSIGARDLNPFFTPSVMSGSRFESVFNEGNEGNEMGPNHSFFHNNTQPQICHSFPRFDPVVPVTGPHGPDVGKQPGVKGQGQREQRERERERRQGNDYPDHLKPPSSKPDGFI